LTWEERMANVFAKHHGVGGEVKKFKIKRGLKMVDVQDKETPTPKAPRPTPVPFLDTPL